MPSWLTFFSFSPYRLNDLCETVGAERHSVRFSEEKSYGGRGGKKGDVLHLVCNQLLFKAILQDLLISAPSMFIFPNNFLSLT